MAWSNLLPNSEKSLVLVRKIPCGNTKEPWHQHHFGPQPISANFQLRKLLNIPECATGSAQFHQILVTHAKYTSKVVIFQSCWRRPAIIGRVYALTAWTSQGEMLIKIIGNTHISRMIGLASAASFMAETPGISHSWDAQKSWRSTNWKRRIGRRRMDTDTGLLQMIPTNPKVRHLIDFSSSVLAFLVVSACLWI